MDSTKIQEMLPDFVRGLLNEEDSHSVQEGLKQSASLRKEYEELRSYYRALETLEPVNASQTFLSAVHTKIAAPVALGTILKKIFTPLQIKLPLELAGLAITVAIVVLIYNPFSSNKIAPLVFDESAMQAKKVPVEAQTLEEAGPEEISEDLAEEKEMVVEQKAVKKKTVPTAKDFRQPQERPKVHTASPDKIASGKSIGLMKKVQPIGDSEGKPAKDAYAGAMDEPVAEMELALAKPAPSSSSEAGALLKDDEMYASKVIKRSDSIVMQAKMPSPAIDDVGLLALSISSEQSREIYKKEELSLKLNALRAQKSMSMTKAKVAKKTKRRREKDKSISSPAQAEPPSHDVTFAVIERKITSNNGAFTLMSDKPQTPDKKYYFIEIPRKDFSALKKELESEGSISDEKFSLETSAAEKIQFNLIISIE